MPKIGTRSRPFNLSQTDRESWEERAEAAVSLWLAHSETREPRYGTTLRVADLGAGNERLRDVLAAQLAERFEYHPYDLLPQRATTTAIDLLEQFPAGQFDVIFCLGLMEYIPTDSTFVSRLLEHCGLAIVSYVFLGSAHGDSVAPRQALNWVRAQDRDEFEQDFRRNGFGLRAFTLTNGGQTGLWLWTPEKHRLEGT